MNKVVSDCNLVLIVCLIQIFVKHLNKSFFGVQLSLIVLGINVNLVTKILSFSNTHDFTPVSQQLFLIKVDDFVLTLDL